LDGRRHGHHVHGQESDGGHATAAREDVHHDPPALQPSDRSPTAPTRPPALKLSALLGDGATLEWHEGVANVQQLTDEIAPDVTRPPVAGSPQACRPPTDARCTVDPNSDLDTQAKLARAQNPIAIAALAAVGCIVGGGTVTLMLMGRSSASLPSSTIAYDVPLEAEAADIQVATPTSPSQTRGVAAQTRVTDDPRNRESGAAKARQPATMNHAASNSAPSIVGQSPAVQPQSLVPNVASMAVSTAPRSLTSATAPESTSYRTGDEGVSELVLLKHYLPLRTRDEISQSAAGVLELIVDTRGLVESVRLNSPSNRYQDRWWLFAAKEWRFEPAMKDGKPVRFLKRIQLTDLNGSDPQ
jgi:hypothetical protein